MSLNEINLNHHLLSRLYASSLIEDEKHIVTTPTTISNEEQVTEWKSLGNNQKGVLVVVNYDQTGFLPDAQMEFLLQLLKACQLSLNDVAVINKNNIEKVVYTDILTHFNTKIVLLFGLTVEEMGFPFQIPAYQVQSFSGYTVTHAPALHLLQNDKIAKGKLWASLRNIFGL